jgi:hypothetical protein
MLQNTILKMKEGGGVMLYPQPILYDIGCKSNLSDGKFTLCANECLVCAQWFHCKDVIIASCAHYATHLALHIMLVLMHVVRLMIVRKHGRVKAHYQGAKNVVTLYYFPRVSMFELQSW